MLEEGDSLFKARVPTLGQRVTIFWNENCTCLAKGNREKCTCPSHKVWEWGTVKKQICSDVYKIEFDDGYNFELIGKVLRTRIGSYFKRTLFVVFFSKSYKEL